MSAWMDWIRDVALNRIDAVERDLRAHPERSPLFDKAVRELHAALDETEAHPNEELTARDGGSSLGVVYGADACAVVNLEGGEALDGTDGT